MEVRAEGTPDLAMIFLDRATLRQQYAQRLQRNALGVQHACDVMVGEDEQFRRRAERRGRVAEQMRVHMPVWAHQRERGHALVQFTRHSPGQRIR